MQNIEYQAAKVLGVIKNKPHDYQDALELPRNERPLYEELNSILGMYVQGVLIINESFGAITTDTMSAYESCCRIIRRDNLAYSRPIPQQVRIKFQLYLRSRLPIEWLYSFIREYRLHLYGSVMWVDDKKREYITDFNDKRFYYKAKGIWDLDYQPLQSYEKYSQIQERLKLMNLEDIS